jgi:hypothetical protein
MFGYWRNAAKNTKGDHGRGAWHKDYGKSHVVQASTFDRRKIETGIRLDRTSFCWRCCGRESPGTTGLIFAAVAVDGKSRPVCGEAKRPCSIRANNLAVPKKTEPGPRQFKVGDRVKVSLPLGRIVDATVKSVIERRTEWVARLQRSCVPTSPSPGSGLKRSWAASYIWHKASTSRATSCLAKGSRRHRKISGRT